jgi:hypothetical protein
MKASVRRGRSVVSLVVAALLACVATEALSATIEGTVKARSGVPISNAQVGAYNSGGALISIALTNVQGSYSLVVAAGTYYLRTLNVPGFADQLYWHIPCGGGCDVTTGWAITVTAAQVVSGINFDLDFGGGVSGTVRNAVTTAVVAHFPVQLYSSSGSFLGSVNTNASGLYTMTSLNPGQYYVRTGGFGTLVNQLYNGITCISCNVSTSGGTLVAVPAGPTTPGINFNLAVGGPISGTVTSASDGAPIQNVSAQIYNSAGAFLASYNSDASGNYMTEGLPAATYYVRTSNSQGFPDELYDHIPCNPSCTVTWGTPVLVNSGSTAAGVDFGLGGLVSVQPTDPPGLPGFTRPIAPNPFREVARFAVRVSVPQPVDLSVFDLAGRRVATLHRGELEAGEQVFEWGGVTEGGDLAPSGFYVVRFRSGAVLQTRRMLLVR